MSLIGNLEDLSLPDILQIISLSKKSGILFIQRGDEEGKIYFRQGKVTLAIGPQNRRNIGNILIEKGLVTQAQLNAAVAEQKSGDMKQLLGAIMVQMDLIDQETLEQVVQQQIEESVYYFLTWRDGTFKFDLKEVDGRLEVGIDPQVLISHRGIDTQWLVLEGTRLIDERKSRGAARSYEMTEGGPGGEATEEKIYLLVDDDDHFSDLFVSRVAKSGRQVKRFAGVGETIEFLSSSVGTEGYFMVIDVVMPTIDGRGFLGGLELARKIVADYPDMSVRIITAYPDDSVLEELKGLNLPPYILKPNLPGDEHSGSAIPRFIEEIFRPPRRATTADTTIAADIAVTTPPTVKESAPVAPRQPDLTESLTFTVKNLESALNHHPHLKLMVTDLMGELHHARTQSEVVLIILRLASELLERAILLKAVGQTAVSLGGFGFESSTITNRDGLRNVSIDIEHSPILSSVLASLKPAWSPADTLSPDDIISVIIGDPLPSSWIILPSPLSAEANLVLYGDNGQYYKTIDGMDVLGLFISLAGLVLRRLNLKRAGGASAGKRPAR